MTVNNNIHNQGFISKWYSYLTGTQPQQPPAPVQKGWGEWLGTPVFAVANYARGFFPWVTGAQPPAPPPPPPSAPPQQGWGEWLGTPVFAVANYAKRFFSYVTTWWKGRNDPDRVIIPIGRQVDSLRKLVIEATKNNVNQQEIAETYHAVYSDLPKYVRDGLEATAQQMLLQGKLRKRVSRNPKPINKSPENALNKAKVILQKPQNKFFDLQPVFHQYLRRMQYPST